MTETLESAYRRHAAELIRYATTMIGPDDAADVVSDAMVNVFAHGASPPDDRVENLRAYLFRAVHHRIVDVQRSRSRRQRREARYAARRRVTTDGPEAASDARALLVGLTEQQRAVVFLTYWSDLPPAEIARLLEISEGSVKKQLARARARLREVLDV